jgi:predicted PurR-regulated permease PerM
MASLVAPEVDVLPEDEERPYPRSAAERRRALSVWRRQLPLAVWALLVLACFYTLHFARALLFPFVLALILGLLLRPLVHALRRLGVPVPVGAAVVLAVLLAGTGLGAYGLSGPAASWVARAPESLKAVEHRARKLLQPLDRFHRAAAQVESFTSMDAGAPNVSTVELKGPGFGAAIFGGIQDFASVLLVVVPLLYLLLASGDELLRNVVRALPRLRDKKTAVDIARETQRQISTYLLTTTAINVGLGVAVTCAMWLIGLPNPLLWGAVAAALSYVPIFGGMACTAILGLAGILTFDRLAYALLPAAVFLVLNFIQDNVVTPLVLGRRLTLNPVVLFMGAAFWWWIWGIPGGLMAVPMITTFKIVCDRTESLRWMGALIGGDAEGAAKSA